MGLFLTFGISSKSSNELKDAVLSFSKISQGEILPHTIDEDNLLYSKIKQFKSGHSVVLFPGFYSGAFDCGKEISKTLLSDVLICNIHDSDTCIIVLYSKGQEVTRFASGPEAINEKKDDWICDHKAIANSFSVDPVSIKNYLTGATETSHSLDIGLALFDFLDKLNVSPNFRSEFRNGFKAILSPPEKKKFTKKILTHLDIRKTKRYSSELIELSENEFDSLFSESKSFLYGYAKCLRCGGKTTLDKKYLHLEMLTVEIHGTCLTCRPSKPAMVSNLAFVHKMEKIIDFLNRE